MIHTHKHKTDTNFPRIAEKFQAEKLQKPSFCPLD